MVALVIVAKNNKTENKNKLKKFKEIENNFTIFINIIIIIINDLDEENDCDEQFNKGDSVVEDEANIDSVMITVTK